MAAASDSAGIVPLVPVRTAAACWTGRSVCSSAAFLVPVRTAAASCRSQVVAARMACIAGMDSGSCTAVGNRMEAAVAAFAFASLAGTAAAMLPSYGP